MKTNQEFIDALEQANIAVLQTIPKTDVHNHAIFGARRTRIEQWAECVIPPPPQTFETLDAMRAYARETLYPVIASQAGVEWTIKAAILDAVHDGVVRLEMSIDMRQVSMYPDPPYGMLDYLRQLQKQYHDSIMFVPELGISRDCLLHEIEPLAMQCIASGVFGSLDLYGNECVQPPETYTAVYTAAKRAGMKLKAHVGEFGSAESVRQTVEILDLDEVQHGIRATESPDVMRWLVQHHIRANVCPTSNVVLSRVADMPSHPIRILYDHGVAVTINTDDPMIFDQSVSNEFLNLFQAGVFTADELDRIRQDALGIRNEVPDEKAQDQDRG
jgi:adenosine deaminase